MKHDFNKIQVSQSRNWQNFRERFWFSVKEWKSASESVKSLIQELELTGFVYDKF